MVLSFFTVGVLPSKEDGVLDTDRTCTSTHPNPLQSAPAGHIVEAFEGYWRNEPPAAPGAKNQRARDTERTDYPLPGDAAELAEHFVLHWRGEVLRQGMGEHQIECSVREW